MFRNYFDLFLSTIWFYTKLCSFNISICRFVQNRFHWCRLRQSFCKTERYGNKMHQVWRKENQIQTCPDLSRPGQAWPHLSGCIPGQAWSVAIQESRNTQHLLPSELPYIIILSMQLSNEVWAIIIAAVHAICIAAVQWSISKKGWNANLLEYSAI